jgi:GNAT superfamily N-acetyltransferase
MTDYQLVTFNKDIEDQFFKFCKEASLQDDPAAINMWADDWQSQPHTLPYILTNSDRHSGNNGEFFLVTCQSEIVGCGGVYFSNFNSKFALAGCRTWMHQDYRNQSLPRELLLPAQRQWAKDHNATAVGITFNDYNKNLISTWKRTRLGENRSPRQQYHLFYDNFNEVKFPVTIQYTKQWIIYEKLDSTFNFDWTIIQCK